MRLSPVLALVLLTATPARAGSSWPAEAAVMEATGRAFVAGRMQRDPAAALALCKGVEDLYGAQGGYLAALVERCYAESQDDKAVSCQRYARAIALWNGPPGPRPDPDYQETRDGILATLVEWKAKNCA
ncbi:MAG: hypothetical protein Q7U11_09205 [Phenylobacterium sp.]|uniref:hypothetical protein n=1 Tax=Phenylobacterium sp. TaxID=1871053 RepID=UPI00271FEA5A|nr:hypothetical protein [Phenylobacterium sp.]MDO9246633.1 hypothetical protein [Phenylobacterium sp.]MDP2009112.1 hypothetical protein [Phenylobacterium sp.]MDP3635278.1 hypothetical protein [Phenylobacterium sp.]MDP3868773.1 hypothetical protein [Phenylobacterium sp.]